MLTLCLVAIGFASEAQVRQGQGERPMRNHQEAPQDKVEKAQKYLELTDEQISQWYKIHAKYAEQKSEMQEEIKGEMKELEDKMLKELNATLTEEQAAKFILAQERMKKRMRRSGGPRH